MAESSLAENGKIGGIKIPGVQSNSYQTSAATVTGALQNQTANRGHNVFRPDIYRVSEGYIS